jgi:hypothetical protein
MEAGLYIELTNEKWAQNLESSANKLQTIMAPIKLLPTS